MDDQGSTPAGREADSEQNREANAGRNNTNPSDVPDILTTRGRDLLRHYLDPNSPAFLNATKAAELAHYKGQPGSNQLAVQGSRTLRRARESGVLRQLLNSAGCTLARAIERLAAAMDARTRRVFCFQGEVVLGPEEDNSRLQFEAAKFTFALHEKCDRATETHVGDCHDHSENKNREEMSDAHQQAMEVLADCDPADRASLRDVLECDATLAKLQAEGQRKVESDKSEDEPPSDSGPNKA
jgi:hypothetical protein